MPEPTDLRALDRELAEAMGYITWVGSAELGYQVYAYPADKDVSYAKHCPCFTSDTAEGWAAMRTVVAEMERRGYVLSLQQTRGNPYGWNACFEPTPYVSNWSWSVSAPHAVARAALAALTEAKDA